MQHDARDGDRQGLRPDRRPLLFDRGPHCAHVVRLPAPLPVDAQARGCGRGDGGSGPSLRPNLRMVNSELTMIVTQIVSKLVKFMAVDTTKFLSSEVFIDSFDV